MGDDNDSDRLNDAMCKELSLHYDSLQWSVITISTAGVGALLGISFDQAKKWPGFCGLALSVLGVFYVASFRSFRKNIHDEIKNPVLSAMLRNPNPLRFLHQWEVFVLSFAVIDVIFVYNLARGINRCWVLFVCVLVGTALIFLYRMGRSPKSSQ